MHARMHPSVSLRAAADHQQTVDMTCGAAVSSGTRTLQRSSSLPVGRPSSSRCCTARTATAAGQGLNRTHWQAGAAGRSRANVGARPRSATRRGCAVRGAHAMRDARRAVGCLRVQHSSVARRLSASRAARGACAAAREGLLYCCYDYEFIRSMTGSVAAGCLSVERRPRPTVLVLWCPVLPAPVSDALCCLPVV